MSESKTRTITLTGRAPVRIHEAEWPVIARAFDDGFGPSGDYAQRQQAVGQGETDRSWLTVRRRGDRHIVYAVVDASPAWTGSEDCRGGEIVDDLADLPTAIRRVGEDVLPEDVADRMIRECIGSLPAEEI